MYGGNAVFAVINIITKSGSDVKNWAEVKGQGETRIRRGQPHWATSSKAASTRSCRARCSTRRATSTSTTGTTARFATPTASRSGDLFAKTTIGEWTAEYDLDHRTKDNRTATYLTPFNNPGSMAEHREDLSLRWDHKVNSDQSVSAEVFYSTYDYNQEYGQLAGTTPYDYWTTGHSAWFGEDVHYDWQTSKQNRIVFGTEAMQAVRTDQTDYDNLTGPVFHTSEGVDWGRLYAQDEYAVNDWLTWWAGRTWTRSSGSTPWPIRGRAPS